MSDLIFRFVPHHLVEAYEKLGWIERDFSPGAHACHSRVLEWTREDPPIEPEREEG